MKAALLALASVLMPTPVASDPAPPVPLVQPAKHIAIPIDHVARRKFSRDNAKLVDALAFINALVNATIQPESDEDHYGMLDYWVMAPADGKGDCEDYAITKFLLIENISGQPVNPIEQMKLVAVVVFGEGHAILAIRLPSGAVMYLDNLNSEPMTRAELLRQGYRFFDWRA